MTLMLVFSTVLCASSALIMELSSTNISKLLSMSTEDSWSSIDPGPSISVSCASSLLTLSTSTRGTWLPRNTWENEEARTEEEISEKLRNPKIYSCLVCEKPFKDLISLDEHVEEHKKDEELTSRSGRKIKQKKFHDDLSIEGLKRKSGDEAKATKVKKVKRSGGPDTSQDSCVGTGVECGICGDNISSHTAHFIHMLSHVPPEIVKTLPVVEGGGVGWCPHCPGPVQLEMVEQHIPELHNGMEEGETDLGLKIGGRKLEFDEIDPEELEGLELPDSEWCVPKVVHGGPFGFVNFHSTFYFQRLAG